MELVVLTFGLVFGSVYGLSNLLLNQKLKDYDLQSRIKTAPPALRHRTAAPANPWRF